MHILLSHITTILFLSICVDVLHISSVEDGLFSITLLRGSSLVANQYIYTVL